MVDASRKAGADVILLGVPRPGLLLRVPALYEDVARRNGIPCDVKTLPKILSSPPRPSRATRCIPTRRATGCWPAASPS